MRHVAPTALVGTSAIPGAFSESAVREMAARAPRPIVLPLSNPTANSEATPARRAGLERRQGPGGHREPLRPGPGRRAPRPVGQANNVFVFPGVGLGAIVARAREVTDRMFLVAATELAGAVSADRLAQGALYPPR